MNERSFNDANVLKNIKNHNLNYQSLNNKHKYPLVVA